MDELPSLKLSLPNLILPKPPQLPPRMTLLGSDAKAPSYRPLVMPSAAQMRQMAVEEEERQKAATKKQEAEKPQSKSPPPTTELSTQVNEITTVTLPGTDLEIAVPRAEIVSTAVVTAGASSVAAVAGTLAAGQVLQHLQRILKPVMKTALKRLAKLRGKRPAESDARQKWRRRGRKVHRGQSRV